MGGINAQGSGIHLADLDGVLDSQNILVSLHDEMSAMLAAFRLWFDGLVSTKASNLKGYCPTDWDSNALNIMSHPELIRKLLTNKFYPLISAASVELEGWEGVAKRVRESGVQMGTDLVRTCKDVVDLGTATVCISYCLNSIKSIALVRSLPIRVVKIESLLLKLKEKKYSLPPCVTDELDKMMADAEYPSEDAHPIDGPAANADDPVAPAVPPVGAAAASASASISVNPGPAAATSETPELQPSPASGSAAAATQDSDSAAARFVKSEPPPSPKASPDAAPAQTSEQLSSLPSAPAVTPAVDATATSALATSVAARSDEGALIAAPSAATSADAGVSAAAASDKDVFLGAPCNS